jgi:hypothetical protein
VTAARAYLQGITAVMPLHITKAAGAL